MSRARNQFQGRPPKCSKCGTLDCHVALDALDAPAVT